MQKNVSKIILSITTLALIVLIGFPTNHNQDKPEAVIYNNQVLRLSETTSISYQNKAYDCVDLIKTNFGFLQEHDGQVTFRSLSEVLRKKIKKLKASGKLVKAAKLRNKKNAVEAMCRMALARVAIAESSIFDLVDAKEDKILFTIGNNSTIDLSKISTNEFNILVRFPTSIGSLKIRLNDYSKTENEKPYTLYGDSRGDFKSGSLKPGSYTLSATPYSKANAKGIIGESYQINFTVVTESELPTPTPTPNPEVVLISENIWQNYTIPQQNTGFKISYKAIPLANNIDSVTGLSNNQAYKYDDLGPIVRFNSDGYIDVRNGNNYLPTNFLPYSANTEYLIEFEVNLNTKRYDVYVTPKGGEKIQLADEFIFRTSQSSLSSINNLGYYALKGSHKMIDVVITPIGDSNQVPFVNAGPDRNITLPNNTITIAAIASDNDGIITNSVWTKVSGPSVLVSTSITSPLILSATEMVAGTYIFRFTATDDDGASVSDDVQVTVNPAIIPNLPPVVNAGNDRTITLPTNSLILTASATDSDGTISTRNWIKVSGGNASLSGNTTNSLNVSGLLAGTYIFRFTATDNNGASSSDDVKVVVAPQSNLVSATLLWNPVTTNTDGTSISNLAGYKVYLGTSAGIYQAPQITGTTASLVLNNLTSGSTYYVMVRAYNTDGIESANSIALQFIAPSP